MTGPSAATIAVRFSSSAACTSIPPAGGAGRIDHEMIGGNINEAATSSNPNAVANARLNAGRLALDDVVEVRGPADLFDSVRGENFDVILFNAPWIQGEPQTLYDTANYDPGYRVLDGFLRGAPAHLASGGVILLQYSDVSQRRGENSIGHLEDSITANGLRIAGRQSIARVGRVMGIQERVFLFEIRRDGDRHYE